MSNLEETTVFGIFHKRAIPDGATPVKDFNLNKYLGLWYELARMDFFWEEADMINTTAHYSMNDDGTVKVVNRGYKVEDEKWKESTGKAKFRVDNTLAALEVSFFGPTWSGYNVLSVDKDYSYALVAGRNTDFLWILSRTTDQLPEKIHDKYFRIARDLGYDLSKLHWIEHREV